MIGRVISHYEVVEKLGEGGMGVVYKARDLHLNRFVALKVLPPQRVADAERKRRFVQEAKAASALNHPGIITVYDIAEEGGCDFIAMEYVEGRTLAELISGARLPAGEAVNYARQIADALAAAHEKGIIHRDLKPGNIMVTGKGLVKVLDFGLAKLTEASRSSEDEATRSMAQTTQLGAIVGTASYMSPEQAQGSRVDARSDIFSFGAVLYEMLTGQRAFAGENMPAIAYAVVHTQPQPLRDLLPEAPRELTRLVDRALQKDPKDRYATAGELARELGALAAAEAPAGARLPDWRKPRVWIPALLVIIVLSLALGSWLRQNARARWAREWALPEVVRLTEKGNYVAAFDLARRAEALIPSDPMLARLWPDFSRTISVETEPPGTDIYCKEYSDLKGEWRRLGRSPIKEVRIPAGFFRWRLEKPGYGTLDGAGATLPERLVLYPEREIPAGMVPVPARRFYTILAHFGPLGPMQLGEYWIDKYEVTNRQFKEFVDRGGYEKPEYWRHPFREGDRILSWEKARAVFRDSTGRVGPATWEAGTYPEGKGDFPVTGVSWYEAAAYAEFAGKQLPTLYHWHQAAGVAAANWIVPFSNFGGGVLARVGAHAGLGPYGTYDMAGNAREWILNETGGNRFILGGAWDQISYLFSWSEFLPPFDRSPENGFRCVKYSGALPAQLAAPLREFARDYAKEKPVSEEVFRVFRSMYSREPAALAARTEASDESAQYWVRQKVSYNAGAAKERLTTLLWLPKNARPPFQVVVLFPGSNSLFTKSIDSMVDVLLPALDFVIKSGRALAFPTFQGTFDRQIGLQAMQQNRDLVSQWVRDLGATIDYLESRPEIDRNKIGYLGFSMGARVGIMLLPFEPRVKAAVFFDGGLPLQRRPPELDEVNFAPRVRVPLLMLNGRHDFIYPVERSQVALFRFLGPPAKDKKHVILESAHNVLFARKSEVARETLDWLDRHLGPVR